MKQSIFTSFLLFTLFANGQLFHRKATWETTSEPISATNQFYLQGGYAFSNSESAPLTIQYHFTNSGLDFNEYYALMQRLQFSPATWTMKPQFTLGYNYMILSPLNFDFGFETDFSYLNFASVQEYYSTNQYTRLDFSGSELRFNFKAVIAYRIKRLSFRVGYGWTSGFAKNYNAQLMIEDGVTTTYEADENLFKNVDFYYTYGAGIGYQLSDKWQITAVWENIGITTSKYTTNSEWFGETVSTDMFKASQISLRLSYSFKTKEASIPVRRKVKNRN